MKKATTIRLQESVQEALDRLSSLERRPKNKMVNEAVAEYVTRKTADLHRTTGEILAGIQRYRRLDPDFEAAIDEFAAAEATHGRDDPAEGTTDQSEAGPLTQDIRRMLNA